MNNTIVIIIVIALALLVLFCLAQSIKNRAISFEESVTTANSDIKVQEKRRVDLIYNLVDCVKNYDAHEAEVLSKLADGMSHGNAQESTQLHSSLNATAYQYPELASNALYKELMNELAMTENLISRHRENYNATVKDYNRYVRQFPSNIVLSLMGYVKQEYAYLNYNAPVDAPQNLFEGK